MRVLVTGGCGFLGAAFAATARAAGHQVTTLDATREADFTCDVGDPEAVALVVREAAPQAIVHLAALLTDACAADPVTATRVNALGTAAVFMQARAAGVERVIHASSNAAVGTCPPGSGDEVALDPRSVYGATKAFGESLARAMSGQPGAPIHLVLRFGWIYGPGRARGWSEPQRVIARVIAGEREVTYPDYREAIDWTYVDDVAAVLTAALVADLPAFARHNAVGDRRPITDAIAHLARRFPDLVAVPMPAELPPSAWGLVNDGLAQRLGCVPQTRLEQGIDRMIAAGVHEPDAPRKRRRSPFTP
jgi:UDP-glucose 4-epimerase